MTIEPIAETLSDPNSYGFRPYRAIRDAIGQCFCSLARKYSPKWIFEADIEGCFDNINHQWLFDNIFMDKLILKMWLKCGFVHRRRLFSTRKGMP